MSLVFDPFNPPESNFRGHLSAGMYHAVIRPSPKGGVYRGQGAKGPWIRFYFAIINHPKFEGYFATDLLSLSPNAISKIYNLYQVIEQEENYQKFDLMNDRDVYNNFYYKPLRIEVKEETYNGKTNKVVAAYHKIEDNQVYNQCVDRLAELLQAGDKNFGAGPLVEETVSVPQPVDGDEDIPF